VGPRTSLDDVEKRKLLILPGLELRSLDRPARSQSLYRLRYPGPHEHVSNRKCHHSSRHFMAFPLSLGDVIYRDSYGCLEIFLDAFYHFQTSIDIHHKNDELYDTCSMNSRYDKCKQNFGQKNLK
jgi:hypothetical protein